MLDPEDIGQPDIRLEDGPKRKHTTVIPCTAKGVAYLEKHFGGLHPKWGRSSWNLTPDEERDMIKAGLYVSDGRKR